MPPTIRAYRALRRFEKAAKTLPSDQKEKLKKALYDLQRPDVPGVRNAKKMRGLGKRYGEIWEAKLDDKCRLTFHMDDDVAVLRNVGPHDILNDP